MRWIGRYRLTALGAGGYVLCLALTPVQSLPLWIGIVLVIGLGPVLTVLTALEWSGHRPDRRQAVVLALGGAAAWLGAALFVRAGQCWWIWHPLNSVLLLGTTLVVGNWLAGELEQPGHLIPVCLLGGLADVWSVVAGPTERLSKQTVEHVARASELAHAGLPPPPPPMASFLIFWWPQAGAGGMASLVGFGDLVFLGLLLGGAARFGLPLGRAFGLVLGGLALSLGLSFWLARPVPALPAVCGLFLAGNLRQLRLQRREWIVTGLVVAGLVCAAAVWALGAWAL